MNFTFFVLPVKHVVPVKQAKGWSHKVVGAINAKILMGSQVRHSARLSALHDGSKSSPVVIKPSPMKKPFVRPSKKRKTVCNAEAFSMPEPSY